MRKIVLSLFIILSSSLFVFSLYFIPSTNSEIIEGSLAFPASNPNSTRLKFIIETVDEGDVGTSTSIALDSNDYPHISYIKSQNLIYARYNGSSWIFETADSSAYRHCSLDLDSNDHPHISYDGLKYAYFNGSSWFIQIVDAGGGNESSISIDSLGNPYISYLQNNALKYAYNNGSSWVIHTIDGGEQYKEVQAQSMALDSYNNPHIGYHYMDRVGMDIMPWRRNDSLRFAYYNGISWNIETVEGEGVIHEYGGEEAHVSIALDSQDKQHIIYTTASGWPVSNKLKYAYFDGGSWNIQDISAYTRESFETDVYYYENSIALDSEENPHISYYKKFASQWQYSLGYAYYNGTSWSAKTVDGPVPSTHIIGYGNSIALNPSGYPHISYLYGGGSELRYALGKTQYLTNFAFKDNSGITTLYTDPAQVQAMDPNGNLTTFTSYSDQWLDDGTWTLKQVIWHNSNVKPSTDPTYTPTPGGTWTINCRVYLISFNNSFEDNNRNNLYMLPSSFQLTFPNGTTSAPLNPNLSYYIQNGTTTWSSIIWQGTEVYPSNVNFDPTDGNPTVNCMVYSLTVDPNFYDNTGTTLVQPSSWSIEFPNGTTTTVSSTATYNQTQTGNYSIVSIIWQGTEVVPETTPITSLTSDKLWSPNINCILPTSISISLSSSTSYVGFKVEINGSLTCNEASLSGAFILLSYSVTSGESWNDITSVNTASDGNYSAVWMPSATGNYLVRATWSGNSTHPETSTTVNLAVTSFDEQNVFSVISNSTISELVFESTSRELGFTVSGPSGTRGYVDVYIAKILIENITDVEIKLNGEEISYSATSTNDSWHLYFTYQHSTHEVTINLGDISAPFIEKPLEKILIYGIFITAIIILITFYIYKKKHTRTLSSARNMQ